MPYSNLVVAEGNAGSQRSFLDSAYQLSSLPRIRFVNPEHGHTQDLDTPTSVKSKIMTVAFVCVYIFAARAE